MAKSKTELAKEALNALGKDEELILADENDSADESEDETNNFLNEELLTHTKLKSSLAGTLVELKKSTAKVILHTTNEMVVDEFGLIHSGFIFGSAEYTAIASINQENVVMIACRSKFYAPAKLGDSIVFEAKGRFEEARKREVKVIGKINDIKVFEGIFQAILLEKHILKTKIDELQSNFNARDFS